MIRLTVCWAVLCAAAILILAPTARAEFEAGQRAWEAGNAVEAAAQWQAAAETGDSRAMLALGRLYEQGVGVPQYYVLAHMWFNLAASRGVTAAFAERDAVAARMTPQQLAAAQERASAWQPVARREDTEFRDCRFCPLMVEVPAGSFLMGSPEGEEFRDEDESPLHSVEISRSFAVGKYGVTFSEWDACVSGGGCGHRPDDAGWGRGTRPVMGVSWDDAQSYVEWLSAETGERYRLLSESEWEYAARAGTRGPFHFGSTISTDQANYDGNYTYGSGRKGVYREETVPVGSFPSNDFGLHDMHGNVWEWVEDCWHDSYASAPADGSAWTSGGDCSRRVLRGGSWYFEPWLLRSANRSRYFTGNRNHYYGFRVARTLIP